MALSTEQEKFIKDAYSLPAGRYFFIFKAPPDRFSDMVFTGSIYDGSVYREDQRDSVTLRELLTKYLSRNYVAAIKPAPRLTAEQGGAKTPAPADTPAETPPASSTSALLPIGAVALAALAILSRR